MRQLWIVLGLCLTIGIASAQTFGEITGEVKDQSGAVAPNAPITATNTATNATRTTRTNEQGIYSIPALNPGTYQVKVEAPGFQPMVRNNVELQVQQTARIDFTLAVGQITQTVEVSSTAALLATRFLASASRSKLTAVGSPRRVRTPFTVSASLPFTSTAML